jgi:Tol biopolymer transport system component
VRRLLLLVALAAAAAALPGAAAPAHRLVDCTCYDVLSIRPDGTHPTLVLANDGSRGWNLLDVTANRARLLFSHGALYTATVTGRDQRLVYGGYDVYDAKWSPDGTKLAFTTYDHGPACAVVHVTDAGGNPIHVFRPRCGGSPVFWAPDSQAVVFERWDREAEPMSSPLVVARIDGSGERALTRPLRSGFASVRWSPQRDRIAYVTGRTNAVHVVRADGSRDVVVAHGWAPRWSPGGRLLALFTARGLATMRRDGTRFRVVDRQARDAYGYGAAWSPDGEAIAYHRSSVGDDLWTSDGTHRRRLTTGIRDEEIGPIWWSGDGRSILYTRLVQFGE